MLTHEIVLIKNLFFLKGDLVALIDSVEAKLKEGYWGVEIEY